MKEQAYYEKNNRNTCSEVSRDICIQVKKNSVKLVFVVFVSATLRIKSFKNDFYFALNKSSLVSSAHCNTEENFSWQQFF